MDRTAMQSVTPTSAGVRITSRVEIGQPDDTLSKHYSQMPAAEWGWEQLRDYCVDQIVVLHGPFPRTKPYAEMAIFQRFCKEWGPDAPRIARYAFEICHGRWGGAPISLNRFCKDSDPFFAKPIADKIHGRA